MGAAAGVHLDLQRALFGLLLSWMVTLAAYGRFRRTVNPNDIVHLPRRSPLGTTGSAIGFVLIVLIILKTWWDPPLALASGIVS